MIMKRKRNHNEDNDEENRPAKKRKIDINSPQIQEFKCPITKQIFYDPVSAADGRIYEEQYIKKWFAGSKRSPITSNIISPTLYPSIPMRNLVNSLIEKHPECKEYQYVPDFSYYANKDTIKRYITEKNFNKLLNYTDYIIMDNVIDNSLYYYDEPIFEYIIKNCKNDNIIKYVLDNCIDIEVSECIENHRPIHIVCRYSNPEMIKYIIDKGVKLECRTNEKQRPVHFIFQFSTPEMIEYIVRKEVGLHYYDSDRETPKTLLLRNRSKNTICSIIGNFKIKKDDIKLLLENDKIKKSRWIAEIIAKSNSG